MKKPWKVIFVKKSQKEFAKFPKNIRNQILDAIYGKLIIDPEKYLFALKGDLKELHKFRVGDYRILCKKDDNIFIITVVKIDHRSKVYII